MALNSCARVLSRLRSLCLPATGEAHRRAIGTKFPLPITIKAPRARPGPVCPQGQTGPGPARGDLVWVEGTSYLLLVGVLPSRGQTYSKKTPHHTMDLLHWYRLQCRYKFFRIIIIIIIEEGAWGWGEQEQQLLAQLHLPPPLMIHSDVQKTYKNTTAYRKWRNPGARDLSWSQLTSIDLSWSYLTLFKYNFL